jgi:large repetitive protein
VGSAERILFVAETQAFGRELWISDGGATAPQLVADLFPGPIGSGPRDLIELDGRVLFVAHSQTLGYEVWSTDGTAAGTNVLADIWPGIGSSEPYDFIRWGDKVVFTTFPGGDSRLWVTDGTPAGTKVLGAAFGLTEQQNPFVVGDKLYFAAASPGFGRELWVTDGTAPNTMQLADAWPGINDSEPVGLGAIGDTLLFYARAGHFDRSLWVTNGTPAGTMEIADINVWPSVVPGSAAVSDGILYFRAEDSLGFELWRSDGTPAGTYRLTDLRAGSFGSYPNSFVAVAGGVFFVADSDTWGVELFRSDGTVAGTGIACDVNPGPDSGAPSDLVWVDGQLAFAATTPLTGRELFVGNLGRAHVAVLDSAGTFVLNSTPPVLGASVTLEASGITPGLVSVLAWSLPVTTPSDVLMLPGSANWLDLGNAQLAGVFAASAWSTSVALPPAAGLVGLVVNVQAFELPGASLPAHASNGLALTLGF